MIGLLEEGHHLITMEQAGLVIQKKADPSSPTAALIVLQNAILLERWGRWCQDVYSIVQWYNSFIQGIHVGCNYSTFMEAADWPNCFLKEIVSKQNQSSYFCSRKFTEVVTLWLEIWRYMVQILDRTLASMFGILCELGGLSRWMLG